MSSVSNDSSKGGFEWLCSATVGITILLAGCFAPEPSDKVEGAECDPKDSGFCDDGYVCLDEDRTCRKLCNRSKECSRTEYCEDGGYCESYVATECDTEDASACAELEGYFCGSNGVCQKYPDTVDCENDVKDGDETGKDCGGSYCSGCGKGEACLTASDCHSAMCLGGICRAEPTAVLAGGTHTCLLLADGALRCWGYGGSGQNGLGTGENIGDDEPLHSVVDVDVGDLVTDIDVGPAHSCVVTLLGGVRCWGASLFGVLGYGAAGDIGDDEPPSSVGDVNVGGSAVEVAAAGGHSCALLDSEHVRCWGTGHAGRLGYGNQDDIGSDGNAGGGGSVDVGAAVVHIDATGEHTCVIVEGGSVRCWGVGGVGQLGYGDTENVGDDELPSSVGDVDIGGKVIQLSTGGYHSCVILEGGSVRCWGNGANGRLGYGNLDRIGDDEVPAAAGDVALGGVAVQISAGGYHTCAVLVGGGVRCWGSGANGRLGYGSTEDVGDDETPESMGDVDVGGPVRQVSAGASHTCALLHDKTVRCWGEASVGRLGYGNAMAIGEDETPASAGAVPVSQ